MKKIKILTNLFLRNFKRSYKEREKRLNAIDEYGKTHIAQQTLRNNEHNDILDINLERLNYFEVGDMRFNERILKEYLLRKQKQNY